MRASNPLKAPSSPLADNSDESIHQSCPLADNSNFLRQSEFSAADNSNLLRHSEFSSAENSNFLRQFEFSAAENSKCGELEAGNSMRGTRYLPISVGLMIIFLQRSTDEKGCSEKNIHFDDL